MHKEQHVIFEEIMKFNWSTDDLAYAEAIARATIAGLERHGGKKFVKLEKETDND